MPNYEFKHLSMKLIFPFLLIIFLFSACKEDEKRLNENYKAICFVSNGDETEVGNGVYMNPPTIHYVLFIYHDTIFQVQIRNKKSTYSYLKYRNKGKDSLQSTFNAFDKTSLKEQLQLMKKIQMTKSSGCGPEGYFLSQKNYKLNFGIFPYGEYNDWHGRYIYKEVPLTINQFPKIYSSIYHTLNSKQWDYFMSNDYYYKEVRTYRHIQFEPK